MEAKESHRVHNNDDDKADNFASELRSKLGLASTPQKTLDVDTLSSIQALKSEESLNFEQEMLENDEGFSDLIFKAEEKTMDKTVVRLIPGKEGVFEIGERIALGKVGNGRDSIHKDSFHIRILEIEEDPVLDRSILLYVDEENIDDKYWIAMVYKGMIIDKMQVYNQHDSRVLYKVNNNVYFLPVLTPPRRAFQPWKDLKQGNAILAKISLKSFSLEFFELEFCHTICYSIAGNHLFWVTSERGNCFIGKSTLEGKTTVKAPLYQRFFLSYPTLFSSEKTLLLTIHKLPYNGIPAIIIISASSLKIEKTVIIANDAIFQDSPHGVFIKGGWVWTERNLFLNKREIKFWAVVTEGKHLGKILCREWDYGQDSIRLEAIENKFIVCSMSPSDKVTLLTPSLI